jgi:hypothetical protein
MKCFGASKLLDLSYILFMTDHIPPVSSFSFLMNGKLAVKYSVVLVMSRRRFDSIATGFKMFHHILLMAVGWDQC